MNYLHEKDFPTISIQTQGRSESEIDGPVVTRRETAEPAFVIRFPLRDAHTDKVADHFTVEGWLSLAESVPGVDAAKAIAFRSALEAFVASLRTGVVNRPKPTLLPGDQVAIGEETGTVRVVDGDDVVVLVGGEKRLAKKADVVKVAK